MLKHDAKKLGTDTKELLSTTGRFFANTNIGKGVCALFGKEPPKDVTPQELKAAIAKYGKEHRPFLIAIVIAAVATTVVVVVATHGAALVGSGVAGAGVVIGGAHAGTAAGAGLGATVAPATVSASVSTAAASATSTATVVAPGVTAGAALGVMSGATQFITLGLASLGALSVVAAVGGFLATMRKRVMDILSKEYVNKALNRDGAMLEARATCEAQDKPRATVSQTVSTKEQAAASSSLRGSDKQESDKTAETYRAQSSSAPPAAAPAPTTAPTARALSSSAPSAPAAPTTADKARTGLQNSRNLGRSESELEIALKILCSMAPALSSTAASSWQSSIKFGDLAITGKAAEACVTGADLQKVCDSFNKAFGGGDVFKVISGGKDGSQMYLSAKADDVSKLLQKKNALPDLHENLYREQQTHAAIEISKNEAKKVGEASCGRWVRGVILHK